MLPSQVIGELQVPAGSRFAATSTIIGHVDPDGSGPGNWSESAAEVADLIRRYTQLGKWDSVLALLRGYDPEARARIQGQHPRRAPTSGFVSHVSETRKVERLGFYRWLRDDVAARMPHATPAEVSAEMWRYLRAIRAHDAAERAEAQR